MTEIRFTENHEWIRIEDGFGIVGITDHAQDEIGDVTCVHAPTVGVPLEQGEFACVLEAVEASLEVCAPITGEIAAVNPMVEHNPEMINSDPLGDGWIFKLQNISKKQFGELMDISEYEDFLSLDPERSEERSLSHISLDDIDIDDDDEAGELY